MLHWQPAHSALQALCARRDNVSSALPSDTNPDCRYNLLCHANLGCTHQLQPWCCFIQLMLGCLSSHAHTQNVIKHRRSAFTRPTNKTH
jgi:hypothetical protein